MKKALLIFIIVAGIIAAVAAFKNKTAIAPEQTESPTASASISPSPTVSVTDNTTATVSPTVSITPKSQTMIINFANGTATPNIVTIKAGDTVKFVNSNSTLHWPASGVHPTHQICPGFDALHGLNNGESYSFKFNEAKTCPWHDHLNPSIKGQIVINP
ncbi:MAG: hypothetical protein HYX20_02155 [Candidatus Yanofskybacteria bacterium]|nr:hypothetical protein [Candidatus Yanofskybacteria bacterium]